MRIVGFQSWVLASGLLSLFLLPFLSGQSSEGEREVQFLSFSAKGRHNIFLRDLEREEVRLAIDGEEVEVRYLGKEDVDTAFAIFLENSPRVAQNPVSIPQWGQVNIIDRYRYFMQYDFFEPLVRRGPVLLGQFFEEIDILAEFTDLDYRLTTALNEIRPASSGIVFHNIEVGRVLGLGVDLLRNRSEKRKVLLLLTSIIDRESYGNLEEYKLMLREVNIDLFVVSYAPRFVNRTGASFEEKMNRYFFRQLAEETSGRAYVTGEFTYLEELFTDLKSRLLNAYTIGFYVQPGESEQEHEIRLEVAREGVQVSCRNYLVF